MIKKNKLKKATIAFVEKAIRTFDYIDDPIERMNQIEGQSHKIIKELSDEKYLRMLEDGKIEGSSSDKKRMQEATKYVHQIADKYLNKYRKTILYFKETADN